MGRVEVRRAQNRHGSVAIAGGIDRSQIVPRFARIRDIHWIVILVRHKVCRVRRTSPHRQRLLQYCIFMLAKVIAPGTNGVPDGKPLIAIDRPRPRLGDAAVAQYYQTQEGRTWLLPSSVGWSGASHTQQSCGLAAAPAALKLGSAQGSHIQSAKKLWTLRESRGAAICPASSMSARQSLTAIATRRLCLHRSSCRN
jgi:hypothetical protein